MRRPNRHHARATSELLVLPLWGLLVLVLYSFDLIRYTTRAIGGALCTRLITDTDHDG